MMILSCISNIFYIFLRMIWSLSLLPSSFGPKHVIHLACDTVHWLFQNSIERTDSVSNLFSLLFALTLACFSYIFCWRCPLLNIAGWPKLLPRTTTAPSIPLGMAWVIRPKSNAQCSHRALLTHPSDLPSRHCTKGNMSSASMMLCDDSEKLYQRVVCSSALQHFRSDYLTLQTLWLW